MSILLETLATSAIPVVFMILCWWGCRRDVASEEKSNKKKFDSIDNKMHKIYERLMKAESALGYKPVLKKTDNKGDK